MPKYQDTYKNSITNKNIPKGNWESMLTPIRGEEHQIIEGKIDLNSLPSDMENDPDDGEPTVLDVDKKVVWTYGVATCHVICMYGWKQSQTSGWYSAVALLHLTDLHTIKDGLEVCYQALQNRGYTNNITSYIIGGQPSSSSNISGISSSLISTYGIKGIVAPLTTNGGGAAAVMAMRQGIVFDVYDTKGDE